MGRSNAESLDIEDFAGLFGARAEDFDAECRRLITEKDFRYWRLTGWEHAEVLLRVFKAAVMTIGCLEQTGRDRVRFIEYLLERSPTLVAHSEPVLGRARAGGDRL